jgi:hypothetical protein
MFQCGDHYFEELTTEKVDNLLEEFRKNPPPVRNIV